MRCLFYLNDVLFVCFVFIISHYSLLKLVESHLTNLLWILWDFLFIEFPIILSCFNILSLFRTSVISIIMYLGIFLFESIFAGILFTSWIRVPALPNSGQYIPIYDLFNWRSFIIFVFLILKDSNVSWTLVCCSFLFMPFSHILFQRRLLHLILELTDLFNNLILFCYSDLLLSWGFGGEKGPPLSVLSFYSGSVLWYHSCLAWKLIWGARDQTEAVTCKANTLLTNISLCWIFISYAILFISDTFVYNFLISTFMQNYVFLHLVHCFFELTRYSQQGITEDFLWEFTELVGSDRTFHVINFPHLAWWASPLPLLWLVSSCSMYWG